MSRKNRKASWREYQYARKDPLKLIPVQQHKEKPRKQTLSRCAFCGRLLGVSVWHYVWDEFGQQVKKCNDERTCRYRRKDAAEKSYRNGMKKNAMHTYRSYWKSQPDETEED